MSTPQFPVNANALPALAQNYTSLQLLIAFDIAILQSNIANVPMQSRIEVMVNGRPIHYYCTVADLDSFIQSEIKKHIELLTDGGVNVDDLMATWEAATAALMQASTKKGD
jgi:hypothetical protein